MSNVNEININSWFVIANPTSGNGNFKKDWIYIKQLLKIKNIFYSFEFTQFSKHEIELVKSAIQKGYKNIISIGGDGTLHHVVNGVMQQRYVKTLDITIAVIPLGTGNDWIKTYKIPKNIKEAVNIIARKNIISQDIGVLKKNNIIVSYFNNVAGIGYDGYIAYKLKSLKKFGGIAYLLAGLYGLLFYKRAIFKIVFNNQIIETNCLMTIFGICKFSGGGMQFTKDINTTDGLLNITIVKNLTLIDLILNVRRLYNGKIVNHKKVETYKTKEITIIPYKSKPFIQADGELIGIGEVHVSVIKKAIQFVIY